MTRRFRRHLFRPELPFDSSLSELGGEMRDRSVRSLVRAAATVAMLSWALPSEAAPVLAFGWDFESAGSIISEPGVGYSISIDGSNGGGLIVSSQGYDGVGGFEGNFMRGAATGTPTAPGATLSLWDLPTHSTVDISFLLALIDSWDSDNGAPAPDYFTVVVDGITLLNITCDNASGTNCYGGTIVAPHAEYGFTVGAPYWNRDIGFDLSDEGVLMLAHSASTFELRLFASGGGWQGSSDESWAVDNLRVVLDPDSAVPEPASLGLLALGLCGAALRRRRITR